MAKLNPGIEVDGAGGTVHRIAEKDLPGPEKNGYMRFEGTGEPVRRYFRETTQADRELVESLRKKYTAGKKRNIAAAKGKIDGDEIDLESVSGEFTDNDYFNKGNFKPPQPEDYHYQGPISEFTSHTKQKNCRIFKAQVQRKA